MKRQLGKTLQHIVAVTFTAVLVMSQSANAEVNIGTGDVAGDTNALVNSAPFNLSSTGANLTLVKTAFLTGSGTQLADGATVPSGTLVDFMIYVNNEGSVGVTDVSVSDVLDPLFAFQTGTIRVDNSIANCTATVCTPAEEVAIYTAAAAATAGTDGIDAPDTVSYDGTDTIDAGNQNVANGQIDAAANAVLAVVFTVQVQ